MLALAVLWTMVPTHAGRSAGVAVRSTSAAILEPSHPTSSGFAPSTTAASTPTLVATTLGDNSTPTTTVRQGVSTSVAPVVEHPVPTYQVSRKTTVERGAVAVAVNGGSLVITTANAVEADDTVDLVLPDGGIETAKVLLVDQRAGIAVLEPDTAKKVEAFTVATTLVAGDVLTFYGDSKRTVTVGTDGTVATDWAGADTREGAPVLNQRGELVALCSHTGTTATLVSLASLDELRRVLGGMPGSAKPWLGVMLADDPQGSLTVAAVDATGPAAASGLVIGDVIDAVDGVTVHDSTALGIALAAHVAGDRVAIGVQHADGSTTTVSVVLAQGKNSL